jgi:hypothetical protein
MHLILSNTGPFNNARETQHYWKLKQMIIKFAKRSSSNYSSNSVTSILFFTAFEDLLTVALLVTADLLNLSFHAINKSAKKANYASDAHRDRWV